MSAPHELMKMLQEAKEGVRAHPGHELTLPTRKRIWRAMGPVMIDEGNRAIYSPGLHRRTMLAAYSTEYVLPIWEQHWPRKDPHQMLEIAGDYLRRRIEWREAWKSANSFSGGLKNVEDIPEETFHSIYVGYAAVDTLFVALKDEDCEESSTLDRDRDHWDASFYACGAYAGELPWSPRSDKNKRLEFWEWYLNDAVPRAYLSFQG